MSPKERAEELIKYFARRSSDQSGFDTTESAEYLKILKAAQAMAEALEKYKNLEANWIGSGSMYDPNLGTDKVIQEWEYTTDLGKHARDALALWNGDAK